MPKATPRTQCKQRRLCVVLNSVALFAYTLSKRSAKSLLAAMDKRDHEDVQTQIDKLIEQKSRKRQDLLFEWTEPDGATLNQRKVAISSHASGETKRLDLKLPSTGASLLALELSFWTYQTDLESPFRSKRLSRKTSHIDIPQLQMSFEAGKLMYGSEEFDEYQWADGSQPKHVNGGESVHYYLSTRNSVVELY